jgi:alpha-mannosidase
MRGFELRNCGVLFLALAFVLAAGAAGAASVEDVSKALGSLMEVPVGEWRYTVGDVPGAERTEFDDSSWKIASPTFVWGEEPVAWFRKAIVVPERIGGFPIAGSRITLRVGVDDDGVIYVGGKEVNKFHGDGGRVELTEKAVPGEKIVVAVKCINTAGSGGLVSASLDGELPDDVRQQIEAYLADLKVGQMIPGAPKEVIEASVGAVDLEAIQAADRGRLVKSLAEAAKTLDGLGPLAKSYTCHLVGHAHIDMNWLWLWPETVEVCKNTFSTVISLMQQFPEFRFSQSQPATYAAVEEADRGLFQKIRERVRQGRWEVTGGTWVEGDLNLPSGESIVRQILYAKRYFGEKFGVEPRICWSPDTFGHAWTIPQILAKSGINYYYFTRCGKGKPLFWWESPDGSRVLAFNDGGYNGWISEGMAQQVMEMSKAYSVRDQLVVYGVGDHGGGPTREMIEKAIELQSRTVFPTVKFSTATDFFKAALPFGKDLPVINDELNFEFRGCYTSHSDIKRMNRSLENLLPAAEGFSAIVSTMGLPYPMTDFRMAWRNACFNQFHDILGGTAIHGSYDYSTDLYDKAYGAGSAALDVALGCLASRIDSRGNGIPVVVFNPLAWTRTDAVEVDSPFDPETTGAVSVTDGKATCPAQIIGDRLSFTARDVPAFGYKVVWLNAAAQPAKSAVKGGADTIENEFFRVRVDPKTGAIASLYDKLGKREVVQAGRQAGLLQILLEEPRGMSAWNIGKIKGTKDLDLAHDSEMIETGPARAVVRSEHDYGESMFVQDVILYEGVPRIDIKMTAQWQEIGTNDKDAPMLKVAFPTALSSPKATFEIPFGSIERPGNGDEVPAQKWIDLSGPDYGVSLLNDCKYGHDVSGSVMRLSLLRASYEPDPVPDVGLHQITYSIYPHSGGWREAGVPRRAYELNNPLRAVATDSHGGKLVQEMSFLSVEPSNLIVTALKRSEDGSDLIVRFYEASGTATTAVISTALPIKAYAETNLLERKLGTARAASGRIELEVGKHEIKTVRLAL